jgi:hypothetical protein
MFASEPPTPLRRVACHSADLSKAILSPIKLGRPANYRMYLNRQAIRANISGQEVFHHFLTNFDKSVLALVRDILYRYEP